MRKIVVTTETRRFIAKAFRTSEVNVGYALRFISNSDAARRMRKLALERGGVITLELPECETIHDANGMMIQTMENGARLECNKETNAVQLIYDGDLVAVYYDVTLDKLAHIQRMAAELGVQKKL